MKFILVLGLMTLATYAAGNTSCLGCAKKVEGAELKKSEEVLKHSLTKLATGDGPYYEVVKINSATRQVVAGTLDKINAELKDKQENKKVCDIEILSQPWLENGIRVTFDCPGENKLVKTHSA